MNETVGNPLSSRQGAQESFATAKNEYLCLDPTTLRLCELEMDRELMKRPSTIAQQVEVELIKRLQNSAPYLLPSVLASETSRKLKGK